jgi:hypothetical protein
MRGSLPVRFAALADETHMRRGELVRMANGSSAAPTEDDELPPGTAGCHCNNCIKGVTIPDGTKCCKSLLLWSLVNPWLDCETTALTLEYIGQDEWLTEPFDGPDCDGGHNEYRWKLTIEIEGRSYLTLVLENDNGCDPVCIIYGRDSFNCQCTNRFSIEKPFGKWAGVARGALSCEACIVPTRGGNVPTFVPGPYCGLDLLEDIPERIDVVPVDTAFGECSPAFGFCVGVSTLDLSVLNSTLTTILSDVQYASDGEITLIEYVGHFDIDGEAATLTIRYTGCDLQFLLELDCVKNNLQDPYIFRRLIPAGNPWLQYDVGPEVDGPSGDPCLIYPGYFQVGPGEEEEESGTPSETGVCDETCDPPPAPEDPTVGSCCFHGECYEFFTEELCGDFAGTWYEDAGECLTECESVWKCCINGTCVELNSSECADFGGTFHFNELCSGEGGCLADETGACCHNNADPLGCEFPSTSDCECEQLTESECADLNLFAGSIFNGVGTACEDFACHCVSGLCDNT